MDAVSILGGTSALFAIGISLIRRRLSRGWITSSSISNPITLTKDHTIIITGGNTGIGFHTALDLAQRGAGKVVLACRDTVAGSQAATSIRIATKNDGVECMELDLGSLESVRKFSNEVKKKHDRLFALVANAGVYMPMEKKQTTKDGFELHFGVNHLGHFLLIQELLPLLKHSSMDSRVVIVSSKLSRIGKIDMNKKDFIYQGRSQGATSFAPSGYCDSKLMNTLTCLQLSKEVEGSNVTTYAVSPGFCQSGIGRNVEVPVYKQIIMIPLMRLLQRSAAQGAQNLVFVIVQDREMLVSGQYYADGNISMDESQMLADSDVPKQLWDLSLELIKEKFQST